MASRTDPKFEGHMGRIILKFQVSSLKPPPNPGMKNPSGSEWLRWGVKITPEALKCELAAAATQHDPSEAEATSEQAEGGRLGNLGKFEIGHLASATAGAGQGQFGEIHGGTNLC